MKVIFEKLYYFENKWNEGYELKFNIFLHLLRKCFLNEKFNQASKCTLVNLFTCTDSIMFLKKQCEIVSNIALMFSVKLDVYENVFFNYKRSNA